MIAILQFFDAYSGQHVGTEQFEPTEDCNLLTEVGRAARDGKFEQRDRVILVSLTADGLSPAVEHLIYPDTEIRFEEWWSKYTTSAQKLAGNDAMRTSHRAAFYAGGMIRCGVTSESSSTEA